MGLISTLLAAACIVFDVTYFAKMFWLYYPYLIGIKKQIHGVHEEAESLGICLPIDLDYMWHMNHAKYLRNFEYARGSFAGTSGLLQSIFFAGRRDQWCVIAAVAVRYRRQVKCFERYRITTKLVYIEGRDFFFEQKMIGVSDSFVKAVCLSKATMTPAGDCREMLLGCGVDPTPFIGPIEDDLKHFIELNRASSAKLNPSKDSSASLSSLAETSKQQ